MTTITNGYITQEDLQLRLGADGGAGGDTFADELVDAIHAASRYIDTLTGQFFYQLTSESRYVMPAECACGPDGVWIARIPPARTISALYTDDGDTGTWTQTTAYITEPYGGVRGGLSGLPADSVIGVDGQRWRLTGARPSLKITSTWGWDAVPEPVRQACVDLAKDEFKRRNTGVGDVAGIGDYAVRMRENSHAMRLLMPFARPGGMLYPSVY